MKKILLNSFKKIMESLEDLEKHVGSLSQDDLYYIPMLFYVGTLRNMGSHKDTHPQFTQMLCIIHDLVDMYIENDRLVKEGAEELKNIVEKF